MAIAFDGRGQQFDIWVPAGETRSAKFTTGADDHRWVAAEVAAYDRSPIVQATTARLVISGAGTAQPPDGISPEEADRLAREADEARHKETQ